MNKDLFTKRLNQLGIKRQVDAAMIVANAQKVINEKFGEQRGGDNLKVVSYRNGVLKIAASSPAWAAECQGIVGQLKTPPIERVVFTVGRTDDIN